MIRTTIPKKELVLELIHNPLVATRELNDRSFYHFLKCFWHIVSPHDFQPNWHIELLCNELEKLAYRVAAGQPREYDLIINVPPGTTKSITCSHLFPAWCWTKWYWMRFITASYSEKLALESAEYCREVLRSQKWQQLYPEIQVKDDKDVKGNFKIVKKVQEGPDRRSIHTYIGGGRLSTSVGGTIVGFHGDILIVDDPLKPDEAASEVELGNANRWVEQSLSTRKTNKAVTPTVLIMQRLHQDDPSGHFLAKNKENVRHICLPGEIRNYKDKVNPPELIKFYKDQLLDPNRLSWKVLADMEADLGQYGYAGQIGQDPTPPGGGMFKVAHIQLLNREPEPQFIESIVRYWDKAGTTTLKSAFTAGVKMGRLKKCNMYPSGGYVILDVKRGRWSTDEREAIIKATTIADGYGVNIWVEQEPGSGGLESAQGTLRNNLGYVVKAHKPSGTEGDKPRRADTFSVAVNTDLVFMVNAIWNHDYIEELRFFPASTYKDQTDASSGAFNKLVQKRIARAV
jgi:predicted phage terminase large subunit-like protein